MVKLHSDIHLENDKKNAIPSIVDQIKQLHGNILLFDELQVTDITDAMLIRQLFHYFIKNGFVMVITSNRHPTELYLNGIQRSSFLPTIDLLLEHLEIINLDNSIDYRVLKGYDPLKVYLYPLNDETNKKIDLIWNTISKVNNDAAIPTILNFLGRKLEIPQTIKGYARIDFPLVCTQPASATDYLEIVKKFHTIVLTNVPKMNFNHRTEAKRFITLIDVLYDNKVY